MPSTSLSRLAVLAAPPLALQDRMVAEAASSALPADGDHGVPPLHWWRRLPAPAFTSGHVATIRRTVAGISIINEPCWPTAARGDPAAAVGVALRAIKRRRAPSPCFDLVMSVLLRCAIEGSTTAALLLEYALSRMTAEDPACSAVAASWQTATVALQPHHTLKGLVLGVEVGR